MKGQSNWHANHLLSKMIANRLPLCSASTPSGVPVFYQSTGLNSILIITSFLFSFRQSFRRDIFMEKGLVNLVNIVKTKTSRFARKEYGEPVLKKYYWKPYFWSDSYFITTVSENSLAVVQDYIRNQ